VPVSTADGRDLRPVDTVPAVAVGNNGEVVGGPRRQAATHRFSRRIGRDLIHIKHWQHFHMQTIHVSRAWWM